MTAPPDIRPGDRVLITGGPNVYKDGTVTEVRVLNDVEWAKVKTRCCGTVLVQIEWLQVVGGTAP